MKHLTEGNKAKLLALLGSVAAVGEKSLKTWAHQNKLLAHQAEDLANALVADGLAVKEERASGWVWRKVREEDPAPSPPDLLDEPAPAGPILPPPPEPSVEVWRENAHRWEKKALSSAEEAHGLRERLARAEEHRERLAVMVGLDSETLWGPVMQAVGRAIDEGKAGELLLARLDDMRLQLLSTLDGSAQETWEEIRQRVFRLRQEHTAQPDPCVECGSLKFEIDRLTREVMTLRQERDAAQGEALDLRGRIEGWREQLAIVTRERDEALAEAQAQARPSIDPGAVGHYLLELPLPHWEALAAARQRLTEARTLAARAQEMEVAALAAVDTLLATPAGEAPPTVAPPVAAPSGETVREEEPAPPSGEGLRLPPVGTLQYDVLQLVIKRGRGDAQTVATKLHEPKMRVASALSLLAKRGILVRTAVGLYEPATALRRAS